MSIESNFFTKAVHAGTRPEPVTGAIMTPIFQTSTYVQSEPGVHKGFDYSRANNPTRQAYEEALATIENAKHALSFSSGIAAEQAIIQTLDANAEVIVCDDVYGGTGRLFRQLFSKYGIKFHFVDMHDDKAIKDVLNKNTKLIWMESPTNPTMKIIDIKKMAALAKNAGAYLVVDNTFATPALQNPLDMGAAFVLHSTTKYIGGHSDVIGGAVMINDEDLFKKVKFVQFAAGAVPSPMECFMLLRSIKTLAVRVDRHCDNGERVASYLAESKKVSAVYYPGLANDRGHGIAKAQMRRFGGMISFDHAGSYDDVVAFFKKLKVYSLAESLGGVESLVNHPALMTHASVPTELRKKLGIGPNLVRLSCGIESADDLIADLDQALNS